MMKIGLTGGIGSGKSTVAQLFSELGIPVIDADVIAREVVMPGAKALTKIVEHFGSTILTTNGELDRQQLRQKVFSDSKERKWLEQLLHPLILEEMKSRAEQLHGDYCLLVIPLLLEIAPYEIIDRILVVDIPEELQIIRAQQRDNTNAAQIDAIIKTQVNRLQRLAVADDVIHNDGNLADLKKQVLELHQFYLDLIKKRTDISFESIS